MADETMTSDTLTTETPKPARTPRKTAGKTKTADSADAGPAKKSTVAKVKETAANLVTEATGAARVAANQGKDKAGEALVGLSKAVDTAANLVEESAGATYGNYTRKASGAVADLAQTIKAKDIDDLIDDTRAFVRKQPMVAIGAAAAAGFVLMRLVKLGSGTTTTPRDDDA